VLVQKRASSEHRYIAAATSSSGRPMRPDLERLQQCLLGHLLLVEIAPDLLPGMSIAAKAR
jgi:hypothetical protein